MNKLAPIQSSHRARYVSLQQPGELLVGAAKRFAAAEGATRIAWGKSPPDPAAVRHLHLEPTAAQAGRAKLPEWVDALPALESLVLPATLLHDAAARGVLPRLRALSVVYDAERVGPPALMRWPEGALPSLRSLSLVGLGDVSGVPWSAVGVASTHAPGLAFLRVDVDKTGQVLDAFADADALLHAELDGVKDLDALSRLPPGLIHLHLGGGGARMPFAPITRLSRLETLHLLNGRFELDCAQLSRLPALREVCLWSTRKLRNVDALLSLPGLESLQAVDCGRPFSKEQKAQLKTRALPQLYVDFA
jgi:hypothetical protein